MPIERDSRAGRPSGNPLPQLRQRGQLAYLAGRAAEDQVLRLYQDRGLRLRANRWRGRAGEIDLVFADGAALVFVEVKKSRSFDRAVQALSPGQQQRLLQAAQEYLACEGFDLMTELRFDVALVNARGEIQLLEAALGHF